MAETSTVVRVTPDRIHEGTPAAASPAPSGSFWTADTRTGAKGLIARGPLTPPLGRASYQVSTDGGSAKAQVLTYDWTGTALKDITALGLSTFRAPASTNPWTQLPCLNLTVDLDGNGTLVILVYEPYYQYLQEPGGSPAPLGTGAWASWDALGGGDAIWWAARRGYAPPYAMWEGASFVKWSEILGRFPSARIAGGYGLNFGSGWNGTFSGAADGLTIGVRGKTTTYDFELGLRADKEDALRALERLYPTGDRRDDIPLEKAISGIEESLAPELWESEMTLTADGRKVFDGEQTAARELQRIVDRESPHEALAQAVIDALVEVDRQLARIAIDAAAGSDPFDLAWAEREMAKGAEATAKPDYDLAVLHYRKAWVRVTRHAPAPGDE